jgi:uncharacterized repeat protein (TIGR01451 family)
MHTGHHLARGPRLAGLLLGAALLALGGTAATAQADAPAPQLSITVDNGNASVTSGDRLSYTVTVTNLGTRKVKDLLVSQTVPTGASFVSADSKGDEAKGKVGWSVDLAAAGTATMRTTMALGRTSESTLRLATVACAQVSAKGPALVCASDSDQLPAGAAVERAQADAAAAHGWFDGPNPWYAGGSAAVVLAAFGAVLATRRRPSPAVRART